MFNKIKFLQEIARTDAFLELSTESQLLFYTLVVESGEKGDVYNAKAIARMYGFDESVLLALYEKRYIQHPKYKNDVYVITGYDIYKGVE